MYPQTATFPTDVPVRVEHCWIIRLPKENADLFGVPEGSILFILVYQENIVALMNLAPQTEDARQKGAVCFLEMPAEMTAAANLSERSILAIGANQGNLYVTVLPPFTTESDWLERIWNEYSDEADVWLFPIPNSTGEPK